MNSSLSEIFESIRDIPYRSPLSPQEESFSCVGKNRRLMTALRDAGCAVRWRICDFKWSDLQLPEEVSKVPHDDNATHAYLEVEISEEWKSIDATWDKSLAHILPVSEWNGTDATSIGVPARKTYSPKESAKVMALLDIAKEYGKAFNEDFKVNGEFYRAFNQWLESTRIKREKCL